MTETPALAATSDEPDDLTHLQRTLLAQGVAARDVVQYALGLIPATGEEGLQPAFDVRLARRLRVLTRRYTTMAVLAARARGATWVQIGKQLGVTADIAHDTYEAAERRWRQGDPAPWAPEVDGVEAMTGVNPIDIGPDDIDAVAADLDAFCHRHAPRSGVGTWGRRARRGMVSAGLRQAVGE